jgi:hypothetical protein
VVGVIDFEYRDDPSLGEVPKEPLLARLARGAKPFGSERGRRWRPVTTVC